MTYRRREIGARLVETLGDMPVVVLTGMRQAGKSTLLKNEPGLERRRFVSLDDFAQLEAARSAPEAFVGGGAPLTIDEAQRCPELLAAIKREVDRDRRPGRFLLSGSANFSLLHGVSETLAGRAVYLTLHPFVRREVAGRIDTPPALRRLFEDGRPPGSVRARPIGAEEVRLGGMPSVCLGEARNPATWFRGYEQTYLERDVRALSQVADLVSFRAVLRLAALRTGQVLRQSEIARDAKQNAVTTGRYLSLLETSFLIARLPPYLGNRASRLIKAPKLYLGDSGLACHLTGVERLDPAADEPLRGPLFETYVAQNLAGLLEARWPEARLHYWHVQGRHEVDFVVEAGRDCLAIEVKAATRWDEHDLAGLRAFLAATKRCRLAVLAHNGTDAAPLGERLWALPLGWLLT